MMEASFSLSQYGGNVVQSHSEELSDDGMVQVSRNNPAPLKPPPLIDEILEEDDVDYNSQLESVLSAGRLTGRDSRFAIDDSLNPPPTIAISQSHLSSERLKALSSDMSQPFTGGWLGSFFSAMLIFFLGFGVGWLLLKHFKPELFEPASAVHPPAEAGKTE
jgi:hypothetical protein